MLAAVVSCKVTSNEAKTAIIDLKPLGHPVSPQTGAESIFVLEELTDNV